MLKVWNLQTQHWWKLLLCWRGFGCLLIKIISTSFSRATVLLLIMAS
ncbi:hypothetical protein PanWU01x14_024940 [Parasponia andersonii]|uniref:Uncharacterized protein n=1 Tax=Parasponia andersonii TaxID=3476 RepID=A0A2P5DWS9_PARAD|nr:hypothetical protein PanWU01x14_024940 [Parasponia andersonii]